MIYSFRQTPFGEIGIGVDGDNAVTHLFMLGVKPEAGEGKEGDSALIREAFSQLEAYFAGRLFLFDLPLEPQGTPFMRSVWNELCKIPYGKTVSYRDIARAINVPGGSRAVGNANGRNPIPIIIPCHRVIASDGTLGGYSLGLDCKRKLLSLEQCDPYPRCTRQIK